MEETLKLKFRAGHKALLFFIVKIQNMVFVNYSAIE
jgi:hypothetical protein